MANKKRLDVLLAETGMAPSREKAKALIMAGVVLVDGEKADKAGELYPETAKIEIIGNQIRYVSRGGLKLEKAMQVFPLSLNRKICMDIGASTGGFTDCMLQNGAAKVYAIDVGYGQLAWALRTDERVINLERTNIRHLEQDKVPDSIDFASIDVSFISLTLVLPVLHQFLKENGEIVCLVKPQFEAGKGKVGKKGVVREPEIHFEVLKKILDFCNENGFCVMGMDYSPVKGPEGNIEYLYHLSHTGKTSGFTEDDLQALVRRSHRALDKGEATCVF
ncbi:MAG: TlyA family RNA methyltransferase [Oscillospiraceae bacterium]